MFEIKAEMSSEEVVESLRGTTDYEISRFVELMEHSDVTKGVTLSVARGTLVFDSKTRIPFKEYQAKAVGSYRDLDGDRWFLTADGGRTNVSQMVRTLKKAVEDARS